MDKMYTASSVVVLRQTGLPSPEFLTVTAILLATFSILPAWRAQFFGTDYDSYYLVRAGLFLSISIFFYLFARSFDANLAIGPIDSVRTGYGDPLMSLRAMACLMVLIAHGAGGVFAPTDIAREAAESRTFWLLFPLPWGGVWIFFTLSGYLMGKAFFTGRYHFSREGILRFYENRLLRLVPLAYFAIAVIVLFIRPDALDLKNIKHLIAMLLFEYDGVSPLQLIGLLWSIATEMQFYLLAPFLALAIFVVSKHINLVAVAVAILVAGTAYRLSAWYLVGSSTWTTAIYMPLLGNIDIFSVGMITSNFVQRNPFPKFRLGHGVLLMYAFYIASAYFCSKVHANVTLWAPIMQLYSPPLFCIATAGIIVVLENAARYDASPWTVAKRSVAATQVLGALTYAIYLWHAPIYQAYQRTMPKIVSTSTTLTALGVCITLVVAFSWVTFTFIEKPFDDYKKARNAVA